MNLSARDRKLLHDSLWCYLEEGILDIEDEPVVRALYDNILVRENLTRSDYQVLEQALTSWLITALRKSSFPNSFVLPDDSVTPQEIDFLRACLRQKLTAMSD